MKALDRLLEVGERACLLLANGFLAAILVGNLINIACRVIADRDLVFVFPWSTVLFVWSVFLGSYVAYRRGRDLRVLFVVERLGSGARAAVSLAGGIVTLAVIGAVLWQAPRTLAAQTNLIEIVRLPRFALSLPLFVGSSLIGLGVIRDMAAALAGRRA